MTMRTLTGRRDGRAYIIGCPDFALPKIAGLIIQQAVNRLAAIEDILGDEYELDRLRELVEAETNGEDCPCLTCYMGPRKSPPCCTCQVYKAWELRMEQKAKTQKNRFERTE